MNNNMTNYVSNDVNDSSAGVGRFCQNCGAEHASATAKFCAACGAARVVVPDVTITSDCSGADGPQPQPLGAPERGDTWAGDFDRDLVLVKESSVEGQERAGAGGFAAKIVASANFFWTFLVMNIACGLLYGFLLVRSITDGCPACPYAESMIMSILANFFCLFFTIGVTLKFLALRVKAMLFRNRWDTAQVVLTMLMVIDVWILPVLMSFDSSLVVGGGYAQALRILFIVQAVRHFRIAQTAQATQA